MNLKEWAEKEVEIACKRENPDRKEGEWDYGCACYESALKAFNSLLEDDHSGFSISITKQILNRLIECKPLTLIEDTPDVWNEGMRREGDDYTSYQCKRMSSLFKDVYDDGRIKYSDIDSSYCVDINDYNITYHSGLVRSIINEMYPITMPYYPTKAIEVYCEEFLTDRRNGDFDTVGVFYAIEPTGEKVEINRFFKEGKDWIEIDKSEYLNRKELAEKLRGELK